MTKSQAKQRHQELSKLIHYHNHRYHTLDAPEIGDYEFDQLFHELLDLENQFPELITGQSPSQRVGSAPLDQFEKVNHRAPMLSLQNTYSAEDILEFDEKIGKQLELGDGDSIEYLCSPKFDGLAIELIYENGVLSQALTRGDGLTGENVTNNVRTIDNIPLVLQGKKHPQRLDVRGEILIYKKDFEALNQSQAENGKPPFANPRNAAAGSMRQLDSRVVASRPLRAFIYGLGFVEGADFSSQSQMEEQFLQWGLPCLRVQPQSQIPLSGIKELKLNQLCCGAQTVTKYYKSLEGLRDQLPFEIDGIVVKVNSTTFQRDLGSISRSPRWAFAGKFPPDKAKTIVNEIIVQVGRTGALTPVAIMEPVYVGGVTITSATLHNQDEIDRKDIREGDTVWVRRAGDVIPEIVEVDVSLRKKSSLAFQLPQDCPSCGASVVRDGDEVVTRCPNRLCPEQLKEGLKHFVSRKAMNIDHLGDRMIDTLWENQLVRTYSDLFRLQAEDILALERQGQRSVQNLLNSLEKSKSPPLARFIFALGLRHVGETTSKTLAENFHSLEKLMKASEEDFLGLDDVGPKVTASLVEAFTNSQWRDQIQQLIKQGVQPKAYQPPTLTEGPLRGLQFVVTGTLPFSRSRIHRAIEEAGGTILKGVSKKTNVLVAGEKAGSKLKKAKDLAVDIWDWETLEKKLPPGSFSTKAGGKVSSSD